jgi:thiaminase
MDALTLVGDIEAQLAGVSEQLVRHPYVAAVEAGALPRDELRRFAGEQLAIIGSDLRSVAHLVSRDGGPFFLSVLDGERAALMALGAFADGLGMSEGDLAAYEPMPGAHAYACYMAWLAAYASPAEVAAAYLVNFAAWGDNCERMSQALQERYGLDRPQVAFFDLFATPDPDFGPRAIAVIQAGIDQGVAPTAIRRSARLLQGYELLYWDTLREAAGV